MKYLSVFALQVTKRRRSQKGTKGTNELRKSVLHCLTLFLPSFVPFVPFCGLIDEVVSDGVVSKFGVCLHIHLVENAAAIGADGFVAE